MPPAPTPTWPRTTGACSVGTRRCRTSTRPPSSYLRHFRCKVVLGRPLHFPAGAQAHRPAATHQHEAGHRGPALCPRGPRLGARRGLGGGPKCRAASLRGLEGPRRRDGGLHEDASEEGTCRHLCRRGQERRERGAGHGGALQPRLERVAGRASDASGTLRLCGGLLGRPPLRRRRPRWEAGGALGGAVQPAVQSLGVLAADAQRPLPGHGRGRPRPALCRRRPRQPGDGFAGADAGGRGELRPTARPMGGAAFAALGTLGLLCVGGTGADLRRGREPREGDGSAEARLAGFLLDLGARGPEAEVWLCRCSSFRHHLRHGGPRRRAPRFLFRALRPSGRWRRWRRWRRWQG
mmetsp:Transcript_164809/g.528798  ORF Transcript_164809/g.528798 Transcript_164809/m.528798 type:complete len:351 (-) Transcript_164809:244-1296(-)